MTSNHLLSASLFAELFQHNLVSSDGRIIASEEQLQRYYAFLVQQSKDRMASLYKERKNMVEDAQKLLELDTRTEEEDEMLNELLEELDLMYDENKNLCVKKPREPTKRYLGPKEPKKTLLEKETESALQRAKVLKRDLRMLDDWLEEISHFRAADADRDVASDGSKTGVRFRERTRNRMCDMENARMKLIREYYDDYDKKLKILLNPKSKKWMLRPDVPKDTGRNVETSSSEEEEEAVERDSAEKDVED